MLVSGMGELLQKAVGAPIRIEVALSRDLAPAMVDPTQAELAILNLAINARDAMPYGGTLAISASNATHDGGGRLAAGDYVVVSVADSGTGMAPEVLERVLEPFFTTKPVGKGSGLGLSMVHGFVTQSGGELRIESAPGRGTKVSLWLPRALSAPEPETASPPAIAAALGGMRVLLVDDDALARMATAGALRALGHAVLEARDAEEALLLLRERQDIALLVTDFAMPQMNGAALVQEARRVRPGMESIMITGFAAALPAERPAGLRAVLRKPFHVEELDALIRGLGRGDAPPPPAEVAGPALV
jgi:CheY-like chemotaxis protein